MNPIPVDQLFTDMPKLFAYELPTLSERKLAKTGDMTKLFFQFEEYNRPRPIWFIVTAVQERNNAKTFTGEIWDRYDEATRRRFGPVQFDASHIYRLPLGRPAIENPIFDSEFRDEKRIAG